jgi:molybdopterin-containing oxidoreductase family iron-sulfur binding subunit
VREAEELAAAPAGGARGFDLVIAPHHALVDGRFAGNAWLLEHPDPVSRLVWDNVAAVGPETARRLGVAEGDWVRVGPVELPVLVQPGTAPDVVVTSLGHGRRAGAGVGDGVGVNTAPLLALGRFGVAVSKAARAPHQVVRTQRYFEQKDRPLVLDGTLAEYERDPEFVKHRVHVPELKQLHDEWDYSKGHKWAMAIDLSSCTGCGICMIACQSENNVPVVGKEECALGREMSWIRIDRYEAGDEENPTVSQQPMLCQHCDNAPCENVCPVNATVHSPEGLNEQVYNRCVGTRYCANNCPYKVRRYNFYSYQKQTIDDPVRELLFNPQVTVRMRGIMEKCTFCVQRINAVKFAAQNAGTEAGGDDVRTACQQACPAEAIVFGDANAPDSAIARARESQRAYHVLEELNVRPNVSYLARIRNPHPGAGGATEGGGHG